MLEVLRYFILINEIYASVLCYNWSYDMQVSK